MTKLEKLAYLPKGEINPYNTFTMGVDFARFGKDASAIIVLEQPRDSDKVYIVYLEEIQKKPLTDVITRILYIQSMINCKKIYCDVTGLGAGPVDILKEKIGGAVEGVTFTAQSKVDMFYNLKLLLQQKRLIIPDYTTVNKPLVKKLFYEFLSIKKEQKTDDKLPRITHEEGTHDDLVCALALACLFFRVGKKFRRSYGLAGVN
jgi:phage FluMu gp28-like protein